MAAALIGHATNPDMRRDRNVPTVPPALPRAARPFRRLSGADLVWLAVRESRAETAEIRRRDGARSPARLGLAIEPGVGVGEAPLLTLEPWPGDVSGDGRRIRAVEFELPVER